MFVFLFRILKSVSHLCCFFLYEPSGLFCLYVWNNVTDCACCGFFFQYYEQMYATVLGTCATPVARNEKDWFDRFDPAAEGTRYRFLLPTKNDETLMQVKEKKQ